MHRTTSLLLGLLLCLPSFLAVSCKDKTEDDSSPGDSSDSGDDNPTGGDMDLTSVSKVGAAGALVNHPSELLMMDLIISFGAGFSTCPMVVADKASGTTTSTGNCSLDSSTEILGSMVYASDANAITATHEGWGIRQKGMEMTYTGTLRLSIAGADEGTLRADGFHFVASGLDPAWGTTSANATFTSFSTTMPVSKGMPDMKSAYTAQIQASISETTIGSFSIEGSVQRDPNGCSVEPEGGSETVTAQGTATIQYDSSCDGCVMITLSNGNTEEWCPPGYEPGKDTGWY